MEKNLTVLDSKVDLFYLTTICNVAFGKQSLENVISYSTWIGKLCSCALVLLSVGMNTSNCFFLRFHTCAPKGVYLNFLSDPHFSLLQFSLDNSCRRLNNPEVQTLMFHIFLQKLRYQVVKYICRNTACYYIVSHILLGKYILKQV